jgi:hypothetical protein
MCACAHVSAFAILFLLKGLDSGINFLKICQAKKPEHEHMSTRTPEHINPLTPNYLQKQYTSHPVTRMEH